MAKDKASDGNHNSAAITIRKLNLFLPKLFKRRNIKIFFLPNIFVVHLLNVCALRSACLLFKGNKSCHASMSQGGVAKEVKMSA